MCIPAAIETFKIDEASNALFQKEKPIPGSRCPQHYT